MRILTLLIAMAICNAVFAKDITEDQAMKVGNDFLKLLRDADSDAFDEYKADLKMVKLLAPGAAEGKSDQELTESMLKPMFARFDKNLEKLRSGLDENGIDPDKLNLTGVFIEASDAPESAPRAFNMHFESGDYLAKIPVSYLVREDKVYIFEILFSTNVWKKQEAQGSDE